MFDFLKPKTKLNLFNLREIPCEDFEIIGIGQINPYCDIKYENEIYLTVVNFINCSKEYDEKEGLILSDFFIKRKCPKCKKIELIPVKMKINMNSVYLQNEEEIAFDAYEEHPSYKHLPTTVYAVCDSCGTCFEIRIKNNDLWIKQSKKIKEKSLITRRWEQYRVN